MGERRPLEPRRLAPVGARRVKVARAFPPGAKRAANDNRMPLARRVRRAAWWAAAAALTGFALWSSL